MFSHHDSDPISSATQSQDKVLARAAASDPAAFQNSELIRRRTLRVEKALGGISG
jgi:hypothetical protein